MDINVTYNGYTAMFTKDALLFKGKRMSPKKWVLIDDNANIISTIKISTPWYHISYNKKFAIEYAGQKLIGYLENALTKPVYSLYVGTAFYRVIIHRGTLRSIFRDQIQIGIVNEERISLGYETSYRLTLDDDADLSIVTTLFYMSICRHQGNISSLTVNFGNISSELQPFDELWRPRSSDISH